MREQWTALELFQIFSSFCWKRPTTNQSIQHKTSHVATKMPKGNWSEYSVYGNLNTKEDNKVKRKNSKKEESCQKICLPASVER